jgi:site-specific DNA-methyltransferase (adenine-specific)
VILLKIKIGFMEYKNLIGGAITNKIKIFNCDCMELLSQTPDNYYSLALVDPPYGIGASEMTMGSGKNKKFKKGKNWDNETPTDKYFNELIRISKNQIIWGGNYFDLPLTKSWILWDKGIYWDCDFADGEMAWTSFNKVLRIAKIRYKGFLGADKERIHPTQKPVALYKWLLDKYAKQGDKILDTHLGSGSIAIACHDYGFELTACELDTEYYEAAKKRFLNHSAQTKLFIV